MLQYAEWSLASTPDYDEAVYHRDKKAFLKNMRMRGSSLKPRQPQAADPDRVEGVDTEP